MEISELENTINPLHISGSKGEKDLKGKVTAAHRDLIAQDIGGDWESLANFIGVPPGDVDDIKEEYRKPLDRRLAMMRRWHEPWGKEATYLRLVEGLKRIGRKDLIDCLMLRYTLRYDLPGKYLYASSRSVSSYRWLMHRFCSVVIQLSCMPALMLILGLLYFSGGSYNMIREERSYDNLTSTAAKNCTSKHNSSGIRRAKNDVGSNCTISENGLPVIRPLFVGRENDMRQVLRKVAKAHIVNINGAPGFGKSTLAIHVGYEVFKSGTSVRYINMEDKVFTVLNQPMRSEEKAVPKCCSNTDVPQAQSQSTSLVEGSKHSLFMSVGQKSVGSTGEDFFEEMRSWSEKLKCVSVLILDNCDDVLASIARHEFLKLINTLVIKSQLKLHVIVVSHEKLVYLDSFDRWTVRELNQSASIQLLDMIAPAIDNKSLAAVAELVEGCPQALKVIGRLLDIYGSRLIHRLKNELVSTLDKASIREERFRVIMDVAFNRLGLLKDCGYVLSLFPSSFDEAAGTAIVQKECWETYLKHSLVDDYYVRLNYRFKMHRIIKVYLQEKISVSDGENFKVRFRKHFVTRFLAYYAIKNELDDGEVYALSLEEPNLYYLRELLLSEIHSTPEELAVLLFLFDRNAIQLEQLQGHYAHYIKMVHKVCPLINPRLCGRVYTDIVTYLYQQCRYETLTAYIQNFYVSPCSEYFQCEVVSYLQSLHTSEVLQLSKHNVLYETLGTHTLQPQGRQYL